MERVLLMTVGMGTAGWESLAAGLGKGLCHPNPSRVVLLASATSQKNAEELKCFAAGRGIAAEVQPLADEDDADRVFAEILDAIGRVRASASPSPEVFVDYTSGTKAMSAGAVLAAAAGGASTVQYITGTRRDGVVAAGTEQFRSIQLAAVHARRELDSALTLARRLRFDAALEVLSSTVVAALPDSQRSVAESLSELCRAYRSWDLFEHERFAGHYDKADTSSPLLAEFRVGGDIKKRVSAMGAERRKGQPNKDLLADLINNAARRMQEGKYDDAVARLYRAIEMHGQWLLRERFEIDASCVPAAALPEIMSDQQRPGRDGTYALGLRRVYELLQHKGHPAGSRFADHQRLKSVLETRNQSLLAHGLAPVGDKAGRSLLEEVTAFAEIEIDDLERRRKDLAFPFMSAGC